jgi:hypothetical protein
MEKSYKIYDIKVRIVNESKKLNKKENPTTGHIEAEGNKIEIIINSNDDVINLAHEFAHVCEYYFTGEFGDDSELADKFEDITRQWWRDYHREKTIEFIEDKSNEVDQVKNAEVKDFLIKL